MYYRRVEDVLYGVFGYKFHILLTPLQGLVLSSYILYISFRPLPLWELFHVPLRPPVTSPPVPSSLSSTDCLSLTGKRGPVIYDDEVFGRRLIPSFSCLNPFF